MADAGLAMAESPAIQRSALRGVEGSRGLNVRERNAHVRERNIGGFGPGLEFLGAGTHVQSVNPPGLSAPPARPPFFFFNENPVSTDLFDIEVIDSYRRVDAGEWDALAGDFPFFKHTFLLGLEATGCATPETGWHARVVLARDSDGQLIGAVPLYVKTHSMGEFVYDWAWADAAQQLGVPYYPKGIVAAPFTPATSSRILVDARLDDATKKTLRSLLGEVLVELCGALELSGVHVLFCEDVDRDVLTKQRFFVRRHHQYHWENHGYSSFDDFLAHFTSKRRREMRRQRRRLAEEGVSVDVFSGQRLTPALRDFAWRCYRTTIDKFPWGRQYLTPAFYDWIFERMRDEIRLFVAFDESRRMLGSALAFVGGDTLYGRYWGSVEEVSFLHFETCLYAPIEYAIAQGLRRIEPGQGGEHKFARGFEATITQSMHLIVDRYFDQVLRQHTAREKVFVASEVDERNAGSAFRPAVARHDDHDNIDKHALSDSDD